MKNKPAAICGRFQIFHNNHLEYLKLAAEKSEHLIIGITNHNPGQDKAKCHEDPERTVTFNNPLTYYERYKMIKYVLEEQGYPPSFYDIVPFPIEEPIYLHNYIPLEALHFITIYDDWGRKKENTLREAGYETEVLKIGTLYDKIMSGTMIRQLIREGKEWNHLVSPSVYRFIIDNGIDKRISKGWNCQ